MKDIFVFHHLCPTNISILLYTPLVPSQTHVYFIYSICTTKPYSILYLFFTFSPSTKFLK